MINIDAKELFMKSFELMTRNQIKLNYGLAYLVFKLNASRLLIERRRLSSRLRKIIDGKIEIVCEIEFSDDYTCYNYNNFNIYDKIFLDFFNQSFDSVQNIKSEIIPNSNLIARFTSVPASPYGFNVMIDIYNGPINIQFNCFINSIKSLINDDIIKYCRY